MTGDPFAILRDPRACAEKLGGVLRPDCVIFAPRPRRDPNGPVEGEGDAELPF
jgi:hypothetical protein